jgi:cytochrome oxidase Cu insertion factor (SCO1/SenC/PrrC family)
MNQFYGILICLSLVSCKNETKQQETKPQVVDVQQNDLPAIRLTFPDGKKTTARELGGKTVLVLFQTDCDHCQREAEQIAAYSKSFEQYKVYFISSSPMSEILKFADTYHLSNKPNFYFAETPFDDVVNIIGPIETPSLYIYSTDRRLVQSFNGEVAIEVVVKYL